MQNRFYTVYSLTQWVVVVVVVLVVIMVVVEVVAHNMKNEW